MKNTYTTAADFWRERDFGAKISAVFEFIGAHWRPLGKCLLYFVLPCALLMGIGLGLFTNSMFDQMGGVMANRRLGGPAQIAQPYGSSPFSQFNFGGIILGFVAGLLSFLLLVSTLMGYLRARLHTPASEVVTPTAVWVEIKAHIGRMLLMVVLLGVGYLVIVGTFSVVMIYAGQTNAFATLFFGMLLFGLVGIYLAVTLSLFFPVLWLEGQSIFSAVGRCFQLIKGQWWATFGLILVVGLIQSMIAIVFIIPQYAVMFGKMLHVPGLNSDVLGLLAQCIYAIGIVFTNTIPLLAVVFQYFNLAEQQEGVGLRLLVDELGQPQTIPVAQSSHYRPDDEGEY